MYTQRKKHIKNPKVTSNNSSIDPSRVVSFGHAGGRLEYWAPRCVYPNANRSQSWLSSFFFLLFFFKDSHTRQLTGKSIILPLFPPARALNVALDFAYSHPCVDSLRTLSVRPKHMGATRPNTRLFSKLHKESTFPPRKEQQLPSPSRQVPYDGWVVADGGVRK